MLVVSETLSSTAPRGRVQRHEVDQTLVNASGPQRLLKL